MKPYRLDNFIPIGEQQLEATLNGPGIQTRGLRCHFRSHQDAELFVFALNMAYDQGYKCGQDIRNIASPDSVLRN